MIKGKRGLRRTRVSPPPRQGGGPTRVTTRPPAPPLAAGLDLFVLAPYHRWLFAHLARLPGVRTMEDVGARGLSELEVLLVEMALAAACEAFVLDPVSSLSDMVRVMRWGYNVLIPAQVIRAGGGNGTGAGG